MAPTGYTDGDGHLEAGLLKSTKGEKQTGYQDYSPLALKTKSKSKSNKMIYFRRALLVIVMGFILGLGVATARPGFINCQRHPDNSKMAMAKAHGSNGELAEALQKASPDLLHRLLHAYLPERYQHGVFATDKDAINAISERDPSVASAIVQIAKRQGNGPSNSNSTTAAGPTSTAPGSSSSVAQSSTDAQSSTASSAGSTTASDTSSSKLYFLIHLHVLEALIIITNSWIKIGESSSSAAGSTTADSSSSSSSAPASTTAESTTASEQSTTAAPSSTPSTTPASTSSSASASSGTSTTEEETTTAASSSPTTAPASTTSSGRLSSGITSSVASSEATTTFDSSSPSSLSSSFPTSTSPNSATAAETTTGMSDFRAVTLTLSRWASQRW